MAYFYRDEKRKVWRFQFTDWTGKRVTRLGYASKNETKKLAASLEREAYDIQKGIRPAPKRAETLPIEKAIELYIESGEQSGGKRGFGWAKVVKDEKKRFLKFWIEKLSLKTTKDLEGCLRPVEAVVSELLGLSPKTINHYVSHLKAFSFWLQEREILTENPLKRLKKMADAPVMPHRLLTPEEVQSLLAAAPPERNLVYRVALATGYRQGELRALTVGSLDPFGPALKLEAKNTKNRKPARQFVTPELFKELQTTVAGKPIEAPLLDMPQKETTSENFGRDLEKAGIVKITADGKATFHSLRVCFIQAIVESGADLKTTMEAARHSAAQMSLETYAKPNPDRLRAAAQQVGFFLSESRKSANKVAAVAGSTEYVETYGKRQPFSNPGGDALFFSHKYLVEKRLPKVLPPRRLSPAHRQHTKLVSKGVFLALPQRFAAFRGKFGHRFQTLNADRNVELISSLQTVKRRRPVKGKYKSFANSADRQRHPVPWEYRRVRGHG
jgi:integrase